MACFLYIVRMSLTAGFVIVMVCLARIFLKKVPKIYTCILWFLVLFRLLCPVSVGIGWSLLPQQLAGELSTYHFQFVKGGEDNREEVSSGEEDGNDGTAAFSSGEGDFQGETGKRSGVTGSSGEAGNAGNVYGGEVVSADGPDSLAGEGVLAILTAIWGAGMIVIFFYLLWSYGKLYRSIRKKRQELLPGHIHEVEQLRTPFVMGLFPPGIYLPAGMEEEKREFVLCHEQMHIRHRDYLTKMLAFLALAIHWFNPLVWLFFCLFCKDMEIWCDEAVLRKTGIGKKKEYAEVLLAFADGERTVSFVSVAFEGDAKRRITHILEYKNISKWKSAVLAVILIVLVTGCGLNPSARKEGTRQEVQNAQTASGDSIFAERNSGEVQGEATPEEQLSGLLENRAGREYGYPIGYSRYTAGTKFDYGTSELYTREEIAEAMIVALQRMEKWKSVEKVTSISYAGDEQTRDEMANRIAGGYLPLEDDLIILKTDFHTKKKIKGGFNEDCDYSQYLFTLTRKKNGHFRYFDSGY